MRSRTPTKQHNITEKVLSKLRKTPHKQKLSFNKLESISVSYNQNRIEENRKDHQQLIAKLVHYIESKEQFARQHLASLYRVEQHSRTNHDALNQLLSKESLRSEVQPIQIDNQKIIGYVVQMQCDPFFKDDLNIQQHVLNAKDEQESLIITLRGQILHQNVLLNKLQNSVHEPLLGMAGLLNQVGLLKSRIDELSTIIQERDREIQTLNSEVTTLHTLFDRTSDILRRYPSLFREVTHNPVINFRELVYDIEQIFLKINSFNSAKTNNSQLQDNYDELLRKYQSLELQKNQQPILQDPKLRTMIDDLSRVILSKDPNAMSKELRDLIKEIFLMNHKDIIDDQEKQIQTLKDQVEKLGTEYQNFRFSVVNSNGHSQYFNEQEYQEQMLAQAKALEKCMSKIYK